MLSTEVGLRWGTTTCCPLAPSHVLLSALPSADVPTHPTVTPPGQLPRVSIMEDMATEQRAWPHHFSVPVSPPGPQSTIPTVDMSKPPSEDNAKNRSQKAASVRQPAWLPH